ncbi:MAG: hypothetical protein ACYTGC_09430 [Planctomycetota bacterium]|jgi:hypothetical protein
MQLDVFLELSEIVNPVAHPIAWFDPSPQTRMKISGSPAMFKKKRHISLRERFLAEQQQQLREDAKLTDPAEAYRALLEELSDERENAALETADRAA